jgi:hypothetical protein
LTGVGVALGKRQGRDLGRSADFIENLTPKGAVSPPEALSRLRELTTPRL